MLLSCIFPKCHGARKFLLLYALFSLFNSYAPTVTSADPAQLPKERCNFCSPYFDWHSCEQDHTRMCDVSGGYLLAKSWPCQETLQLMILPTQGFVKMNSTNQPDFKDLSFKLIYVVPSFRESKQHEKAPPTKRPSMLADYHIVLPNGLQRAPEAVCWRGMYTATGCEGFPVMHPCDLITFAACLLYNDLGPGIGALIVELKFKEPTVHDCDLGRQPEAGSARVIAGGGAGVDGEAQGVVMGGV
ncbi:hypothetical protein CYMTET_55674 [Cymbomonas tetramitiformis]|uniref:Uncharacterized protein n=1 Tax=Cymbomonas tetramitiformis TaxID=36881 RepID=A0AAE0BDL2_9CHLO|nr:hypothetical protein CYMTET_55674 [Cymbomonas tetramitiformis]